MTPLPTVDMTGTYNQGMHAMLAEAARHSPLAVDELSGATVVLRQHDVEALARDQRVVGVGLTLFDLMGIDRGSLRAWYSRLMFTTQGDIPWRQVLGRSPSRLPVAPA